MSEAQRLTRVVYDAFREVVDTGKSNIRAGDVIDLLRERDYPLFIWNVTGEFTTLEALQLIQLNQDTGDWTLVADNSFDEAKAKYNGDWESLATNKKS